MLIGEILRQNAMLFPDHPCLIQDDLTLTHAEVERRVNALANGLLALGLSKGDRLGLLSGNCYQYPEMYFACAKSGIIGVPLNARLAVPEMISFLRYTKPKGLIVHAKFADAGAVLQQEVPGLEHIIGLEAGHLFALDYDELIRTHPQTPPRVSVSPDDVYLLGSTSGTTGIPKGAILTHRNASISALIWYAETGWPQFGSQLQAIPQFFNPGGPTNMGAFMKAGAIIVLPEFSPVAWMEQVQRYRPYLGNLVPTMLNMVVNHPDVGKYDLSSLKAMITGGSPIPELLLRRCHEVFGNIFYPAYGLCETYSCGLLLRRPYLDPEGPQAQLKRLASAGHPMVNVEVRVANEQDQDVRWGSGEAGEIIVRGDQVSPGYWEMPEETAASRKDGWFYTGDLAVVDEEGFIFIVDRKKDMIITGGINVFSAEVERAILSHPAVAQAAVVGVPDRDWGEAIKAMCVLHPGKTATEAEIIEHCRERLASFKKPKSVEFRDALPLGGTGKVLKRVLREPYWAGHNRQVN